MKKVVDRYVPEWYYIRALRQRGAANKTVEV